MSFYAPIWLLAGLASIIVILLHTLRRTQIEVPSLLLWRKLAGVSQARPVPRLPKVSWLMLLQVLAVLLIAIALARPYWGDAGAEPAHRIYLLDASASMSTNDVSGASRFEAARAAIAADIAGLDPTADARLTLISAGAGAWPVAVRFDDAAAFSSVLASLVVTDGAEDWAEVAPLLDGVVRSDEASRLAVYTDNGAAVADLVGAYAELMPQVWSFGAPDTPNAGVAVEMSKGERETDWAANGTVTLSGGAALEAVGIFFRPLGGTGFLDMGLAPLGVATALETGAAAATFRAELSLPGAGTVRFVVPDDAAAFDNVYSVQVDPKPAPLRALYIGTGNRPIELALAVNPRVELFSTQVLPVDVDSYDLVLADNVALPRVPQTNMVWLGSGRGPDVPTPSLTPASPVLGWNSEHMLARGVDWQAIRTLPAYGFAPLAGGTVLLESGAGPAVEARTMPWGRELRIALAFEGAAWTDGPQLPALVNRMLEWTGALPDAAVQAGCVVGDICSIPGRLVSEPVRDEAGNVVWSVPVSGLNSVPDAVSEGFRPQRAGIVTMGGNRPVAVNAPAGESVIAAGPAAEVAVSAAPWPLWQWLLLGGIALLVLEAVLAGFGKERFLHVAALASSALGARRRRWLLAMRVLSIAAATLALFAMPLPVATRSADHVRIARSVGQDADCGWSGMQGAGAVSAGPVSRVVGDIGCGGADLAAAPDAVSLEAAVRLAAGMTRPGTERRLLLDADAPETMGAVASTLDMLRQRGIAVDIRQAETADADGAGIVGLYAPAPVFDGDSVPLTASIHSDGAASLALELRVDGALIESRNVDLAPGSNRVEVLIPDVVAGEHVFEVALGDGANDRGFVAVSVRDAPLVAIVTPEAEWGNYFAEALNRQGLRTAVLRPDRAPFRIEQWLDYDSVVLLNTPAIDLNTVQQRQLEEYVRVYGKGLMILGGENSFGPGGYFMTALEDVSPLSARVPNDLPVAALAFVLDRSGSMQAMVDGVTRLDIAKEATLSAIELLNDESQVAVIVFDTLSHVLAPMRPKNAPLTAAMLAPLQPGGGTFFQPALEDALNEMEKADAPVRHIILMSDGLSQPGDYDGFASRAREAGITLSVVAIGSGADVGRLEAIARSGGGSFHSTTDFRALPSILSQEAMMLSSEPMQPGVQPVIWADRSASFLQAMPAELPPIQGFVETTAKPEAVVHLETLDDEGELVPLMASWSYGNGKVLAFGTHGAGQGTAQWLAMENYPLLWSQAIRHFASSATMGPQVALHRRGDTLEVIVRGSDQTSVQVSKDGQPFADLPLTAQPDGTGTAGIFAPPGVYAASVATDDGAVSASLAVSYPARLTPGLTGDGLLALASATGGRVLGADEAAPVASLALSMDRVWRPWAVMALLLFLLDLTMRYAPGYFGFLRDARRGADK